MSSHANFRKKSTPVDISPTSPNAPGTPFKIPYDKVRLFRNKPPSFALSWPVE